MKDWLKTVFGDPVIRHATQTIVSVVVAVAVAVLSAKLGIPIVLPAPVVTP